MKGVLYLFWILSVWGCTQTEKKYEHVFEGAPRINAPYVTGNYPHTEFVLPYRRPGNAR